MGGRTFTLAVLLASGCDSSSVASEARREAIERAKARPDDADAADEATLDDNRANRVAVAKLEPLTKAASDEAFRAATECTADSVEGSAAEPLGISEEVLRQVARGRVPLGFDIGSPYDSQLVMGSLKDLSDEAAVEMARKVHEATHFVVVRETSTPVSVDEVMGTYRRGKVDVEGLFFADGKPVCKLAASLETPETMAVRADRSATAEVQASLRRSAATTLSERYAKASNGAIERLDMKGVPKL